ncbi:MarR family winged helix-turn-helix transcriptional regulator [Streptomyces sp. NBC_01408]|uniref:MarR family winged helix-turn-helix transcriptional regulator n=1 Tax=Streptomyces sp. NBC_01408 TaxID=2903855 RepID=UPI00224E9CF9|nr:MarR family winged helix-turn-helix transcriptional regulator [Streptomyces sp. NBC_01408]MCX4693326.1 MarR family winged helix-turn-helix transcriptional regulator [Streptomyces sp. NBC_01408]
MSDAATPQAPPKSTPAAADAVDAIIGQWYAVRPELETAPMAVFGRIFRIGRAVGDAMEEAYGRYGISRGEFDVVGTLRRSGAPYTLSPRQLSATLMLTTGGMTGRLDKLEKAGLLCRKPDPHDRRGLQVTITDRGLALVDEAVTAGLEVQRAALTGLGDEEVEILSGLLRKLLAGSEGATGP